MATAAIGFFHHTSPYSHVDPIDLTLLVGAATVGFGLFQKADRSAKHPYRHEQPDGGWRMAGQKNPHRRDEIGSPLTAARPRLGVAPVDGETEKFLFAHRRNLRMHLAVAGQISVIIRCPDNAPKGLA